MLRQFVSARTFVSALALSFVFVSAGLSESAQSLTFRKDCARIPERIIRKVKVPRYYHEGLYYDGKSMWLCNGEGGKIWVVDTGSGNVLSEIDPVACFTEAITAKGDGTFYTTEWDEKRVYRVRIDSGKLVVESCVSVEPSHPAGVIWNGSRLYAILWNRGLTGTKFSIAEMDEEMKVLKNVPIKIIQEPCQLAWDGAYLWMTSWYDGRVYKVDASKWEVLGYFCSPLDRTTGIACDGKRLWLTATYGDLYQMEVGGEGGAK